jgi:hypothetical protein
VGVTRAHWWHSGLCDHVRFSKADLAASPFPEEQRLMRMNVERQKGWLVLSPSAEQIVVETGHAV